jgi:hypothetical protein
VMPELKPKGRYRSTKQVTSRLTRIGYDVAR